MKTSVLVFVFGVLLGVGAYGETKQLLLNPSFEESESAADNPYGDLAANWGRWGNWMNRETGWKPTRSGECMAGYHHWQIEKNEDSGLFQDVSNVPPKSVCTFSVYATRDADTDPDSIEIRIEKAGGFQPLASQSYSMNQLGGTWEKLSVTATNSEAGVRVLIAVKPKPGSPRGGAVKFDDASLEVQSP